SPQVAIRVSNPAAVRFDLALVTFSATAKFDLSLLDAVGKSDLRNITIEGDILSAISAPELAFFALDPRAKPGVVLPQDNVAGVEVSGTIPVDVIQVGGIEAVAFGTLLGPDGKPVSVQSVVGSHLDPGVLSNLLGNSTAFYSPTDTLRLPSLAGLNSALYVYSSANQLMNYANAFVNQVADEGSLTTFVNIATAKQFGTALLRTTLPP
ncbi:MAG TPA: hypothetical protein VG754_02650, partial [Verrucomicrobiae bacterium]|nr:hypothetical protein [Verrucomicrobiae bacterium]